MAKIPRPPLKSLIDHIDHIAKVAGVDHVGLGSDFDGVSGATPQGIDSAADLPKITQALLDRGLQRGRYQEDSGRKSDARVSRSGTREPRDAGSARRRFEIGGTRTLLSRVAEETMACAVVQCNVAQNPQAYLHRKEHPCVSAFAILSLMSDGARRHGRRRLLLNPRPLRNRARRPSRRRRPPPSRPPSSIRRPAK